MTKPFEASLKNYISLQAATSDRDSNSKQQQTQRNTDSAKREGAAGSARERKGGEGGAWQNKWQLELSLQSHCSLRLRQFIAQPNKNICHINKARQVTRAPAAFSSLLFLSFPFLVPSPSAHYLPHSWKYWQPSQVEPDEADQYVLRQQHRQLRHLRQPGQLRQLRLPGNL